MATMFAEPSFPGIIKVTSNSGDNDTDLSQGFVLLKYYESITQDTVKADFTFADTGYGVDGKSVLEGLPLVGTEEVEMRLKDNYENELRFTPSIGNSLYVNKVTPIIEESKRSLVNIKLVSEEAIRNEQGSSRVNIRMDGRISDHIKRIFTDFLKTEKELNIDETSNNYNFIGNGRKPYYLLNWLSKASVPSKDGKEGDSAGFLFYETSEGYYFRSIDSFFAQDYNGRKWKKKYIYNESSKIPADYDGKILEHTADNRVQIQEKLKMGAYQTKLVVFDPFNCAYRVFGQTAKETEDQDGITIAGTNLPQLNDKFEFNAPKNSTRTTYMLFDTGSLPTGNTKQQVESSAEQNFKSQTVLNQAIRRYNQLFSVVESITIAADYSLHAGDAIFVDFPALKAERDDEVDKEYGGLYIIADLCHYISSKETYTKLNLVRDSFGRINPRSK